MHLGFFINDSAAEAVAQEHLLNDMRSARLSRIFQTYYRLRPMIPISLRQRLQKNRKVVVSDSWYVNDVFMRSLTDSLRQRDGNLIIVHPWPDGTQFAFVLTHDVETREGFQMVARIADIEQDLGFRSSWNLIPYKYKIDDKLINDLVSRGFEIGIHGYNHDGKLYLSERTFRRRATAINKALSKFGAVGFRSPMVHRNLSWLQMLDIEYDASCFDVDPYQAMPGGVGGIWPFVVGKFVELPYTLPQDHTLFVARGDRDCCIWREKLRYVVEHNGMALMLTHPDYLDTEGRLAAYREFLLEVREAGDYWHALPKEVVQWWNGRERSSIQVNDAGTPVVTGPAQNRGRCAHVTAHNGDLQFSTEPEAKQSNVLAR